MDKEQLARLYCFYCTGCKLRKNKRGSAIYRDGKRFCRSCMAFIGQADPKWFK